MSRKSYRRCFKSFKYVDQVAWTYSEVKELLRAYRTRKDPGSNAYKYRIRFIRPAKALEGFPDHVACTGSRKLGRILKDDVVNKNIVLLPAFFEKKGFLPAFAVIFADPLSLCYDIYGGAPEGVMLHELCHAVSTTRAARKAHRQRTAIDSYVERHEIDIDPWGLG
jgi:hypothetical protein